MIVKKVIASLLTTVAVLTTSTTVAMADWLVGNGIGGDYNYQLWQSTENSIYYLKIWRRESDPNRETSLITFSFQSSREALDYFDCHYAEKSIPGCTR